MSKIKDASILSLFILICNMFIFNGLTQSAFIFYCLLGNVVGRGNSVVISCIHPWIQIKEHRCNPG